MPRALLVIDALLIVDQPLPQVLVSETVNAASRDRFGSLDDWKGVGDAEVVITQGEQTFLYRPISDRFTGVLSAPAQCAARFAQCDLSFVCAIARADRHGADGHARQIEYSGDGVIRRDNARGDPRVEKIRR